MKEYYPSYFGSFTCAAGECKDTCCAQWEIVIDRETENKYRKIKGAFGEKLCSHMVKDKDGDTVFLQENGKCPFLRDDGLCDIHIILGEELTSEVCKIHPRFIEEYESFKEISLSLSCPVSAEIIEKTNNKTYPVPDYNGNDNVLSVLIESRRFLLSSEEDILSYLETLSCVAADDMELIDGNTYHNENIYDIKCIKNFINILFSGCEILRDSWKKLLENALSYDISEDGLKEYIKQHSKSVRNITDYFIYRYYLKAVNDLDIYFRGQFIIMSVLSSVITAEANNISFREASRLYSKETEHNTVNREILLEFLRNSGGYYE